jgi:uncharacterized protein (TIGR02118 family)
VNADEEDDMTARLLIQYGRPEDPDAFERYYAEQHIPYATEHMPNLRNAQNSRVVATADGSDTPIYRVSQLEYEDVASLRAGLESDDGRSTLADLANFATGGATLLIVEDD